MVKKIRVLMVDDEDRFRETIAKLKDQYSFLP